MLGLPDFATARGAVFEALIKGPVPERLLAAGKWSIVLQLLFVAVSIAMDGLWLWSDPLPLVGFYLVLALSVGMFSYESYLRFYQAIDRLRFLRSFVPDIVLLLGLVATLAWPETLALVGSLRALVVAGVTLVRLPTGERLLESLGKNPARMVVVSFALIISVGTLLLLLPRATVNHTGASFIDALFTATSATCVTGLTVLNTNFGPGMNLDTETLSLFGQVVVLALIQVGGLSIMTLSTSAVLLVRGGLSLKGRSLMASVLDEERVMTVPELLRFIVLVTLGFEAAGAGILYGRFSLQFADPATAVYYAVFHSISAFCNAGFSLFTDSLESFVSDPVINLTFAFLIFFGGIGFTVLAALFSPWTWRRGIRAGIRRFPVHGRLVIATSGILVFAGTVVLLLTDWNGALGHLDVSQKLWGAFFQSVTARTAGFNTVDIARISRTAVLVYIVLMFIGASPGGTGGGIKTSTFALTVLSLKAILMRREAITVFRRTVPRDVVLRATAVTLLAAVVLGIGTLGLLWTQPHIGAKELVFEAASAFGTVGLSMGATLKLDVVGRLILVGMMFVGRVGPLTATLALSKRARMAAVEYPECRILVG